MMNLRDRWEVLFRYRMIKLGIMFAGFWMTQHQRDALRKWQKDYARNRLNELIQLGVTTEDEIQKWKGPTL